MQYSFFPALLAVLFIGLKLAHIIAWSWLWVLCPLWFGAVAFVVLFIVFAVGYALIKALFKL